MSAPRPSRTDDAVDQYLDRSGHRAHLRDPQYAFQIVMLRMILSHTEDALEAEHVPSEIRARVISRILYGGLDEEEALHRIAEREQLAEELMRQVRTSVEFPQELLASMTRGAAGGEQS